MSKYYIAYGSNLSVEQMKTRTPDAKIIGTGMLKGWRLLFRQFATIIEERDFETPVLVWEISEQDEEKLDKYEGFPKMYEKRDLTLPVTALNGENLGELTGMAYTMTPKAMFARSRDPIPFYDYLALIYYNYKLLGFDKKIIEVALAEVEDFALVL